MTEKPSDLPILLRAWRGRVQPEDVGLRSGRASRKTPGLRREEVAWIAGVSPDYVKRLEQGRAHPSIGVVRALARTLRLSESEFELACRLAGHAHEMSGCVPQHVGPGVQRMLDRLADTPVAVFDAAWTLLDHNELWSALTGEHLRPDRRLNNLVWRSFIGDAGWVRHPNPETRRASLIADLKNVAARYPADRELTTMIATLRKQSEEFAQCWEQPTVSQHNSERKIVDHPELGPIEVDCDVLTLHGTDLRLVVFTTAPRSRDAGALELLTVVGSELTGDLGK